MELPILLAALAAFLPIAYGAPVEQADVVLSSAVLTAIERDLGLDATEAIDRFTFESGAVDVIQELRSALGESFVSAWVEDGSVINVATSNEADAAQVQNAGATHKVVKTDISKLQAAKEALDHLWKQPRPSSISESGISLYYVDVITIKLIINALPEGIDEAKALAKSVGLTEAEFEVRQVNEKLKPIELRGGGGYAINRSAVCSVGFNVRGGYVSAGHCGSAGADITYLDGTPVGTMERSDFPQVDMSYISTLPSVQGPGYVGAYGIQRDQAVRGSNEAAVGSGICRSGTTTGWRCGEIQAYDVSVDYGNAPVFDLVLTTACAQPGDSGGSFISGDQAQGVASGAGGGCSDSDSITVYQRLNPILSRYGLSLTTA